MGFEGHIIVWDLDGTLGEFRELERAAAHPGANGPIRLSLRPGIRETIRMLTGQGFVHSLLTLSSPRYAKIALHAAGLTAHFSRVEGRGQRGKGDAAGIASEFGLGEHERPHRMIFVGDHPLFDRPKDPGVLFHLEPHGLQRPASELGRLVLHLRTAGQGSLVEGFESIMGGMPWWRTLVSRWGKSRKEQTIEREVEGLGSLLLYRSERECPVVAFADPPRSQARPDECEASIEALE